MTGIRLLPFLLAGLLLSCSPLPRQIPQSRRPLPKIMSLIWSKDFSASAVAAWEAQIARRWPDRDIVVLMCHGSDSGRPWSLCPDPPMHRIPVENAVAFLHQILPRRLIVVLSCNKSASPLHTPDVAFARKRVWVYPGPDQRCLDGETIIDDAGNIDDFEVTK
jgi:hypothetical protein